MGGAARPTKPMHEIFRDTSSQKVKKHQAFLHTFLDRGYEIVSQDMEESKGAEGEIVHQTLITILKPIDNFDLPTLKFEAVEIFGKYNDDTMVFSEWDEPGFEMRAFQKGSRIDQFRDPWRPLDLQ